jgi:hypothetical protein
MVLLVFGAPSQHSIAGGAGARPDHHINGLWLLREKLRRRLPSGLFRKPLGCRRLNERAGMRWRAFFSIIGGAAAWPAVARAQSPGAVLGRANAGCGWRDGLALPIVGRIVPFGKPTWWPALGIYFAGCGNLWYYRSLGQNLCWRFEWSARRKLGSAQFRTPVSSRLVTRPLLRVRQEV